MKNHRIESLVRVRTNFGFKKMIGLTVVQGSNVVGKHAQQIAEAHRGEKECEIKKEKLPSIDL